MNAQRLETGTRSRNGYAIGSLFSGIGGLELGLETAGVGHTVYQIERNEFCRAQLRRHWPDVPQWDDVATVDPAELPAVDVVCGGFPCQDVSVANAKGARDGLRGARSGLWFHMARIVAAQRPRWVVVENNARGWRKWLPGVECDLRREGYRTLAVPLAARFVGAPHDRQRLFVLAYADSEPLREREQRMSGRRAQGLRDGGQAERVEHRRFEGWQAEPRMAVVEDGIPQGMAGEVWSAIGNAVVPQCAEVLGWMIRELDETEGG